MDFLRSTPYLVSLIPISILFFKLLEIIFQINNIPFYVPPDSSGNSFVSNFIEWFGVLYGILLPLILVRTWEQLDDIDREFDREADTVRILYEDIFFLRGKCADVGKDIVPLLRKYVVHVKNNYPEEIKSEDYGPSDQNNSRKKHIKNPKKNQYQFQRIFNVIKSKYNILQEYYKSLSHLVQERLFKTKRSDVKISRPSLVADQKIKGDQILDEVRREFRRFFRSRMITSKASEILVEELFHRLNEIIDIRGDRIALASQRLFQSLRLVALITSITFILPFYFVGLSPQTPLLDDFLIVAITLLVIFIYMIIEDLDEPFGGAWKISVESWDRILDEMDSAKRKRELKNLGKSTRRRNSPVKK